MTNSTIRSELGNLVREGYRCRVELIDTVNKDFNVEKRKVYLSVEITKLFY